ncbi:MAG: GNAT family N-acetyltransferase, partial [Myxococcota bacterium]|nr:GNAT family N-acetyltransferase [Myxococcota bacterium]
HDACRALWVALTEHHRRLYRDPTIGGETPGAGFDAWWTGRDRVAAWVAERGGEVVGMTGLLVPPGGDEGEVEPVVVRPDHRGAGVGTRLVAHAVAEARRRGLRFANVRPVGRNREAIRFFADRGFDVLGRVELSMPLGEEGGGGFDETIDVEGTRLRR